MNTEKLLIDYAIVRNKVIDLDKDIKKFFWTKFETQEEFEYFHNVRDNFYREKSHPYWETWVEAVHIHFYSFDGHVTHWMPLPEPPEVPEVPND